MRGPSRITLFDFESKHDNDDSTGLHHLLPYLIKSCLNVTHFRFLPKKNPPNTWPKRSSNRIKITLKPEPLWFNLYHRTGAILKNRHVTNSQRALSVGNVVIGEDSPDAHIKKRDGAFRLSLLKGGKESNKPGEKYNKLSFSHLSL